MNLVYIVFGQFPHSDGFSVIGVFTKEGDAYDCASAQRISAERTGSRNQYWVEGHEVLS